MTKTNTVLKSKEKEVEIKSLENFQPKEFFVTNKDLYIWSDFTNRISSKAEEVKKPKDFKLNSYILNEDATDEKIESELPEKYIFSETDVCAVIASLISNQSKSEEGILENNGYANLFYTSAFVVRVAWDGDRWDVYAWVRGGYGWYADGRVFSPAD